MANTAAAGQVPDSVRISFYVGAVILVIFSLISVFSVHEYDNDTYKKYHGVALNEDNANEKSKSMLQLLKEAPKTFWVCYFNSIFLLDGFSSIFGLMVLAALRQQSIMLLIQPVLVIKLVLIGLESYQPFMQLLLLSGHWFYQKFRLVKINLATPYHYF